MSGEGGMPGSRVISDLGELLAGMEPVLNPGEYAFVSIPGGEVPPGLDPIATIREREGLSLVIEAAKAEEAGLEILFCAAWISLTVHSDLAALGLTAAFSSALAAKGISCNVVAGAFHDHIFVPYAHADRAMEALITLAAEST